MLTRQDFGCLNSGFSRDFGAQEGASVACGGEDVRVPPLDRAAVSKPFELVLTTWVASGILRGCDFSLCGEGGEKDGRGRGRKSGRVGEERERKGERRRVGREEEEVWRE